MNIVDIAIAKSYTEASLTGAGALKGDKGDDGVSVSNMEIDANGHLITYYDNGTSSDCGEIPTVSTEVETLVETKVDEKIDEKLADAVADEVANQLNLATDDDIEGLW